MHIEPLIPEFRSVTIRKTGGILGVDQTLRLDADLQAAVLLGVMVMWVTEPVPVTVREPAVPVLVSRMPLVAPFALAERKVMPEAPIVVFWTFSAVPAVVLMVLPVPTLT